MTLLSLTGSVTHKHIRLYLDNTVAISYITNFGGRKATLHKLAQKLWFWCIDRNIWISAAHVPGKCNVEANKLSHKLNDDMEWALKPELFQKLENLLGEFDIDLFASRLNNKKSAYVSFNPDPHAMAIDAFSFKWTNKYCYIFPPFSVIQKLAREEVQRAVLIAPIWLTQVWFPPLLQHISKQSFILPKNCIYLPQDENRKHPIKNLRLGVFILSGKSSQLKDYQQSLPTSF